MPQGPQNPVRQQFPQRRNDNEFGDEMESKGGETPKDSGSPPNHTAITPPPSQVAARNQQQHQQHHPPAVYRQQEGYPSKGDPNVAATTAPQAAQAHQPAAANTAEGPRPRIPQHRKRSKFSRRNIAIANGKSKNRLFAIVHPLHLAVIFFSVVAVAMIGAALGTSYWYLATAGSYYTRVGLFNQCDGNGNCQSLQFNSVTTSMCTRSGDDLKQINNAVLGLAIAGGVLSLLALILASISRCVAQVATSWIVLVATLLCTGCYAAAVGLFVAKKEGWEFCNTDFCSFIKQTQPTLTGGCDTSYGYSMGLAAVAIGSGFLSFLFALFRIIFREWNIVDESAAPAISNEELAPQNRPRAHGPTEPYPAADVSDAEPPEESAKIPPPPEGDWVYDQECGMYWSESEFLFLDPYTQHSYDPNSDMWYDPDVDEWYQGEQIDQ